MTIASTLTQWQYDGNNATVAFSYNAKIFAASDLLVGLIDASGNYALQPGSAYSVTGVGNDSGGQVIFNTPPPVGTKNVDIRSDIPVTQGTSVKNQGQFLPELHEEAFDRATREVQDLKRKAYDYSFHGPDTESSPWRTLPTRSARANTVAGWDGNGDATTFQSIPGGSLSQPIIGGYMWPQNAGEISGGQTPVNNFPDAPILDMRRWMNGFNTGTDITAAVNAALASGYRRIWLPAGHNLIDNVAITADDVHFIGDGESSRLTVINNNSRLWNVTGQRFKVFGIKCEGDGTSNSTSNGVAAYLNGAGGAVFEDVSFDGFGFGAIAGVAASPLAGPKITRTRHRNTGALGVEIYLGGIWVGAVIQDIDAFSASADRALLLFDNGTTGWVNATVRGGGATGYLKQQFACTDENWDGSNRVWNIIFDGVTCKQSNWSGIKAKTSRGVKVINCTFDQCGLAQEDQPNGLYGDVLVNSLGKVMVAHSIFRNSGSTAIRCIAPQVSQYPATDPGGKACDQYTVDHNQIDNTGVVFAAQGDAIALVNGFKRALVDHNTMKGVTLHAVNATQTATSPFWDLGLFDNTVGDSPAMTSTGAWSIGFGHTLRMNGNEVHNCGAVGAVITDIQNVVIGAQDVVLDPAAGSGRGYQIGNVQDLDFKARAGNSTYSAWPGAAQPVTIGQRVQTGGNVYEYVVAGNTGGSAPTHTSGGAADGTATAFFVGKYQLMPYAIRLVGTQGKVNLDFNAAGCITGPIENLIMGSGGTRIHYTTSIATANATPTNAQVIPIPDLSAWMCDMRVLANDATTPNRAMFGKAGLFYRAGAGTTREGTLQQTIAADVTSAGAAAWTAVPAVSGNNLIPAQVTGAAGKNINWQVEVSMLGMP